VLEVGDIIDIRLRGFDEEFRAEAHRWPDVDRKRPSPGISLHRPPPAGQEPPGAETRRLGAAPAEAPLVGWQRRHRHDPPGAGRAAGGPGTPSPQEPGALPWSVGPALELESRGGAGTSLAHSCPARAPLRRCAHDRPLPFQGSPLDAMA
jgi:hypothetical protein